MSDFRHPARPEIVVAFTSREAAAVIDRLERMRMGIASPAEREWWVQIAAKVREARTARGQSKRKPAGGFGQSAPAPAGVGAA